VSLKALAQQVLARNAARNFASNTAPERATAPATAAQATAVVRRDVFEERVAIIQEGAQVPEDWAKALAEVEGRQIPVGVNGQTWLAMINAAGRFLDEW
jgi:hypothetical protein